VHLRILFKNRDKEQANTDNSINFITLQIQMYCYRLLRFKKWFYDIDILMFPCRRMFEVEVTELNYMHISYYINVLYRVALLRSLVNPEFHVK
jgi:hypothetical protein